MKAFHALQQQGENLIATFQSPMSGYYDITFTPDQLTKDQVYAWINGELIQNAMPNLTAVERDHFLSGYTAEEQADIFQVTEE